MILCLDWFDKTLKKLYSIWHPPGLLRVRRGWGRTWHCEPPNVHTTLAQPASGARVTGDKESRISAPAFPSMASLHNILQLGPGDPQYHSDGGCFFRINKNLISPYEMLIKMKLYILNFPVGRIYTRCPKNGRRIELKVTPSKLPIWH